MRSTFRLFMAAILLTRGGRSRLGRRTQPGAPAAGSRRRETGRPSSRRSPSRSRTRRPSSPRSAVDQAPRPSSLPRSGARGAARAPRSRGHDDDQARNKEDRKKPAEKPAEIQVSETFKPAASAASTAAVDTTANRLLRRRGEHGARKSIAPPPPAANQRPSRAAEETIPQTKLGIGSWILGSVARLLWPPSSPRFLRRAAAEPTSIVDFTTISS